MKREQVPTFYAEIAAVCAKYGVGCAVGMWFDGEGSDLYGFLKAAEQGNIVMMKMSDHIAERLQKWADEIHKGPAEGLVHVTGYAKIKK